jgi:hypothetical protein
LRIQAGCGFEITAFAGAVASARIFASSPGALLDVTVIS